MVITCELDHNEVKLAHLLRHGHVGHPISDPVVVEDGEGPALADCGPSAAASANMSADHRPSAEMHAAAGHAEMHAAAGHVIDGVNITLQQACFPDEFDESDTAEADASGAPTNVGRVDGQPASAGCQPASAGQPAAASTDSRSLAAGPTGASSSLSAPCCPVASVALAPVSTHSQELVRKTLKWATGTNDATLIAGLEDSLPEWAINEQVQKYNDAQLAVAGQKPVECIRVNQNIKATERRSAQPSVSTLPRFK